MSQTILAPDGGNASRIPTSGIPRTEGMRMTEELEEMLNDARAGDAAVIGRLLELYRRYLSLLARVQIGKRLQGKVDASDIVQDTFLEAHKNFARFRGQSEGELVSWLRHVLAGIV